MAEEQRESAATCPDQVAASPLATPGDAVSFASDVLPVFERTCTFSACHGSAQGSNNGVFLGTRGGGSDTGKVHAALVGGTSSQLLSMRLVTPGDPDRSFLLRKLDGDTCALDAECVGGSCGQRMPRGSDALDGTEREIIRRWIANGAPR